MKSLTIFLTFMLCGATAFAQSTAADSLKRLLQNEREDTNRVKLLARMGNFYVFEKPEAGLLYAQQALDLARSIKYTRGEANSFVVLGHLYRMTGNFTPALKSHLSALQIFEKLNDRMGTGACYLGIAANYEDQADYKEALSYYYKAKAILEASQAADLSAMQSNMGLCYLKLGKLDSALKYEQSAYELSINTPGKALVLARLGSIHSKMGNHELALSYFRMGIPLAIAIADNNALEEALFGVSLFYQGLGQSDSCIYYAKKTLATGQEFGDPLTVVDACDVLFSSYKNKNADSAFKYLQLSASTKDTLLTQDKMKQEQVLAFEEKNRQQQIENDKAIADEKRKENIQYAAIAISLICFVVVFLLLSHSIIINAAWVRFLGVLALLILFEFINLLAHPYLAHWTNDSPVFMLAALVIIGAMLVPLHHRIEKWVIGKMVEKNKRVRLEAAKKIIASIEREEKPEGS